MSETSGLGEYLKSVAGWGRVRHADAQQAAFLGNALEQGQSEMQASVGWALSQRRRAWTPPKKLRKPPARVVHDGRVTRRVKAAR